MFVLLEYLLFEGSTLVCSRERFGKCHFGSTHPCRVGSVVGALQVLDLIAVSGTWLAGWRLMGEGVMRNQRIVGCLVG